MSRFDDAMELSVEAEVEEMGDPVFLDGVEVQGVVSEIMENNTQSTGGRRDVSTFSVFVNKADGEGVVKGCPVEADGRKGRVIKREDLGGGGWELICGPVSSWSGRVPGV
jgi:hypothetical protein